MASKKGGTPSSKKARDGKVVARTRKPAKAATPSDHATVNAWIAAVAPERRAIIKRIDRILRDEIPGAVRTTKWRKPSEPLGTPFYGRPGHGWVAMVHSLKHEMRVTFFDGAKLDPPLPVAGNAGTRRVDITGPDDFDEGQLRSWAGQAAKLEGWAHV
jgi:hypothetical protein